MRRLKNVCREDIELSCDGVSLVGHDLWGYFNMLSEVLTFNTGLVDIMPIV